MTTIDQERLDPLHDPLPHVWENEPGIEWADNYIAGFGPPFIGNGALDGAYDQVVPFKRHLSVRNWFHNTIRDVSSRDGFYFSLGGGGIADRPAPSGPRTVHTESFDALFNGDFDHVPYLDSVEGEELVPGFHGDNYSITPRGEARLYPNAQLTHNPTFVPADTRYLTFTVRRPRLLSHDGASLDVTFEPVIGLREDGQPDVARSITLSNASLPRVWPWRSSRVSIPIASILQNKPHGTAGSFTFTYSADSHLTRSIFLDDVTLSTSPLGAASITPAVFQGQSPLGSAASLTTSGTRNKTHSSTQILRTEILSFMIESTQLSLGRAATHAPHRNLAITVGARAFHPLELEPHIDGLYSDITIIHSFLGVALPQPPRYH